MLLARSLTAQKTDAKLDYKKQSVYELGTLGDWISTGQGVMKGAPLPVIPAHCDACLHHLLPLMVHPEPGRGGGGGYPMSSGCSCVWRVWSVFSS